MTEMVERVKRELAARGYFPNGVEGPARAVIAAMREPTEAMLFDSARACWGVQNPTPARLYDVSNAWQAMIDAALKE